MNIIKMLMYSTFAIFLCHCGEIPSFQDLEQSEAALDSSKNLISQNTESLSRLQALTEDSVEESDLNPESFDSPVLHYLCLRNPQTDSEILNITAIVEIESGSYFLIFIDAEKTEDGPQNPQPKGIMPVEKTEITLNDDTSAEIFANPKFLQIVSSETSSEEATAHPSAYRTAESNFLPAICFENTND